MESPVGSRRTQACPANLPRGHNNINSLIWVVAFLLSTGLKVLFYAHFQMRRAPTDLSITAGACTAH